MHPRSECEDKNEEMKYTSEFFFYIIFFMFFFFDDNVLLSPGINTDSSFEWSIFHDFFFLMSFYLMSNELQLFYHLIWIILNYFFFIVISKKSFFICSEKSCLIWFWLAMYRFQYGTLLKIECISIKCFKVKWVCK